MSAIRPVILSGGSGSRLWPLSQSDRPKQFLDLVGEETLFMSTIQRAALLSDDAPIVVTGGAHIDLVSADSGHEATIVVEPAPRNTAAAIVAAALLADNDDVLVVLPADHLIADTHSFVAAVKTGVAVALQGGVVTLGVLPTRPETGYGWIKIGEPNALGGFDVDSFIEKPDLESAVAMLAGGAHYWNSGVFIARASQIREAAKQLAPDVLRAVAESIPASGAQPVFLGEEFAAAPSVSFDKAIMEHLPGAYVVPLDAGWSDVGSWVSVWENVAHDAEGNATRGRVVAVDTSNSLIWALDRPLAVVGLDNVVVVETRHGILVAAIGSGQSIRAVVDDLNQALEEDE